MQEGSSHTQVLAFLFGFVMVSTAIFIPIVGETSLIPVILFDEADVPRDYWPTDDWQMSTPENQGMNTSKLDRIEWFIDDRGYEIDSVLVVRGGYLVYEYYGEAWDRDDIHHFQSCTKCVTSTLVGIAIDLGLIESVNSKMVDFFEDWTIENMDDRKRNITIEHLLTWTDGMEFHEGDYPYDDPRNDLGQMWVSEDALQYCLDRPMWNNPGESWWMNSGTLIILGGIIEIVSGMSVQEFASEYLFGPIGITNFYWSQIRGGDAGGWYHTDGGLYMTPRDFAKFGYLMLNNGTWDDQQIVSQEWVENATEVYITTGWGDSYANFGYQWWIWPSYGLYAAHGHYEQALYVVPEQDIVVIFTGDVPDGSFYPADYIVSRYILPAVEVDFTEIDQTNQFQVPLLEVSLLLGGVGIGIVVLVVMRYAPRRRSGAEGEI
ncbi:MAG: serine hydrolase domain-containing protein [Candidatus Thorarchaeota archaeon]